MNRRRTLASLLVSLLSPVLLWSTACGPAVVPSSADDRQVIDVRTPGEFAEGHHYAALNLQLGWDQLRQRARVYVPYLQTPLAVHAAGPDQAAEAYEILRELGYEDVVVTGRPRHPVIGRTLTAEQLLAAFEDEQPPFVIDIREESEHAQGFIPGALRVNPDRGPESVDHLDRSVRYAVICAGGWRSSQLQSWMEQAGFGYVQNVIDGMSAWVELPDAPLQR